MAREMKDSGIEWIGDIPKHWTVHPIYCYFSERKNKNFSMKEHNLLSLSYGKIIKKDINALGGLLPASFNTYNIVERDDIIIRPTDLQNDKKSLRTGLVQEKGIITSAYFEKKAFINKILQWIDEPCDLNEIINNPYYEVIKFFNSYTKETFKTKRYLFYSKKDNDYSFINNLYAFDLKKHIEMKLYTFDNYSEITRAYMPPLKLSNIVVDDLSQNLSNYQKRECKKAFIELANIKNSYFKVQHYWVMELIKLAIQPVLVLHEWDCHRCFFIPKLFGNIWVYDIPSRDEEPSFFITDKNFTKVAVLKFKSPEYLFKGIYKRAMAKAKGWELTTKEIKELMYFLNSPSDRADEYGSGQLHEAYKKYVKTNWQQLIFEYNHNTAGWGWGDEGFEVPPSGKPNGLEPLPLDLPMPDYTKLIKE